MTEETYKWTFRCKNCEEEPEVEIPMGVTLGDYLSGVKGKALCPHCGCETLEERKVD